MRQTRPARPIRRSACVLARAVMDTIRMFVPNTISLIIEAHDIMVAGTLCAHLGLPGHPRCRPFWCCFRRSSQPRSRRNEVALIGRYRRSEHPLWSYFVWRDEMINAAQEQLADEWLLRLAMGTPVMSMYLRAMGADRPRCVVRNDGHHRVRHDRLADGMRVNRGGCLMTHLFHDRLLQIGPTSLDPGATLGPTSVVLPDTHLGTGTRVSGHSVVLRGEELPAGTRWHGTPVEAM